MKLREGTFLQGGKYKIIKLLGQGGFGITYLAEQVELGRKVAIKEFFMRDYCERDKETSHVSMGTSGSREMVEKFRQKFVKEAQTIATLKHPHIIAIHDIFRENNTAYYVMEYIDSGSLSDKINNCGLSEAVALRYIRQVADALGYIHKKSMNHLDVKPGNVLIDEEDNAVLIDFGLAKHYDEEGRQTTTTPVGISRGYAPGEQYKRGGVSTFSPATDIYSLGATLYKALTGVVPPEAEDVRESGLPPLPSHISEATRRAVECAMQPRRADRPQSVAEFLALLDGKGVESVDEATLIDDEESSRRHHTGETTILDGDEENTAGQSAKKNSGDSTNTPEPDKEKKPKRWLWILLAKQELIQRLQKTSDSNVQTELKHSNVPDTSFPSTIEYKANFNEGANSIGGKIIITPDLLIFKAHSSNFGDLSDRIFKIQDVSGYRKGFLTFLYIQFKYGYEIKLTVWKKQEIITEIENRRKLLIASK